MEKERNYGIDLLKIMAMLMIAIIHTQGHGGILFSGVLSYTQETFFYSNYAASLLIESFIFPAINCYALITGYVNWNRKIRYYKLAIFWIQILFYMISIASIYSIVEGSFDQTIWFNAFFPIMSYQYWYMTAYVSLFLFMPILNSYIQQTFNRFLILHLAFLFILFSIMPQFLSKNGDPFLLNQGYSAFWLILMYITGGVISKCDIGKYLSKLQCSAYFLLMILITWGYQMIVTYLNAYSQAGITLLNVFRYVTPTIVLASIFLLLLFSKITINNLASQKVIMILSNTTLGVYLIHDNPFVRVDIISGYAKEFATYPVFKMVGAILLGAATIYVVCTLIDIVRIQLFKLLNIDNILKNLEIKLATLLNKTDEQANY